MARSDALCERAIGLAHEAQRILDDDDGSPKTHARIEELTSRSERLMAEYARLRADEEAERGRRYGLSVASTARRYAAFAFIAARTAASAVSSASLATSAAPPTRPIRASSPFLAALPEQFRAFVCRSARPPSRTPNSAAVPWMTLLLSNPRVDVGRPPHRS